MYNSNRHDILVTRGREAADIRKALLGRIPNTAKESIYRAVHDEELGQCIIELCPADNSVEPEPLNTKYGFYLKLPNHSQHISLNFFSSRYVNFIIRQKDVMADMVDELIKIETSKMKQ